MGGEGGGRRKTVVDSGVDAEAAEVPAFFAGAKSESARRQIRERAHQIVSR